MDGNLVYTGAPLGAGPTGNPSVPANLDNTSDLFIGVRADGMSGFFVGALDELELFNRALTPQEIQAIYSAGPKGKCKATKLCLLKFEDANGNGNLDSGETLLPNWQFNVTPALPANPNPVSTGSSGAACFTASAGSYTISEVVPPGWTPTTPASQTVTLATGQWAGRAFGNKRSCYPQPSGLVAWWPLDEGNGATILQEVVGNNHAEPAGTPVGGPNAPHPYREWSTGGSILSSTQARDGAMPACPT